MTPIVIITATLSYAAMIFSGPLAPSLPVGIGYGLVSAGVMAIVFALGSSMPFAIAGPDSKIVAVLATLAAVVAADVTRRGHASDVAATVMFVLVAGTLLTGLLLYLFGLFQMGRWIRFVPYPVVAGFMAASGGLLAIGGIRLVTSASGLGDFLHQLTHGQRAVELLVAIAFAAGLHAIKRVKHPLALPALLFGGTLAVHLVLGMLGYSLAASRNAGWLLDLSSKTIMPGLWLVKSMSHVEWVSILWAGGGYIALFAVTAMTLLLGLMAIEVDAQVDVDLDHELRLNGLANMLVGACGGMTGTLSMSRTVLNYRAGGRHRASGILAGIICLLTLAFGTRALGFVPVPILGGLLLQLGADLLHDWLVKGWSTMQRPDYFQMAVIFLVIVAWDFVAGVALGVIAACITFAFNTSRLRLVRLGLNRTVYSGRVDRPAYQQEQLVLHGHCIQLMWLHSFIFFGSAHRLLLQIEDMIKAQKGSCRSLILDFRQVLGIDSSAVMSFIKLRQIADREGFTLVLSEMPPQVAHALQVGGLIGNGHNRTCRVFTNTDGALEWCEENLLDEIKVEDVSLASADNWLASEIGSDAMFTRLTDYLEVVKCQTGDLLIRQGEVGDSLYLLFAGRVTVLLRTQEGAELRLRSMVGHTIVGEMGLYRTLPRGASVRADQPTVAYRMTRDALARMEKDDSDLAYAFHKLVIRTLAARLDFSNREVASLQR